ncbi:MAG: Hsp20 family protein, partial [Pseudomonadota bacterium]|nr:Hsp20 family protein [Pseudomonadota bacterium]
MRTTFDTIWRDLSPFTIGFDRTFDTLSLLAKNQAQNVNYPPYNIRKLSDNKYSIELALAGFEEKDIDIEVVGENLVITGKRSDDSNDNLVHQGLAARNFNRKF